MINKNTAKGALIFNLLIIFHFGVYGQSDTSAKAKSYRYCIEWLDEMKPAILADTMGRCGAKWSTTDRLLIEGCNFVGELFPVVENYFGLPDKSINYSDMRILLIKNLA